MGKSSIQYVRLVSAEFLLLYQFFDNKARIGLVFLSDRIRYRACPLSALLGRSKPCKVDAFPKLRGSQCHPKGYPLQIRRFGNRFKAERGLGSRRIPDCSLENSFLSIMASQLIVKPTSKEVASSACDWLIESIAEVLQERGRCVVALSGGTTPRQLYELIAQRHLDTLDWRNVHLLWGDERNVHHTEDDSNYQMVRFTWLDRAEATKDPRAIPNAYPVPINISAPVQAAQKYGETIRQVLGDSSSIDIVLLGLGDDAHTASLFPDTEALNSLDGFVANYVPKFEGYRLTMTASLINQAKKIAFLVCGTMKAPALDVVWHGPRDPMKFPAQLIHPTSGDVWWFVEACAAPRSGWI